MSKSPRDLILASGSPRRRELLSACGVKFDVIVSGCEETVGSGETPRGMVERLALAKALAVADAHPADWVLGADTDVCVDGEILGKPRDAEDAARLLRKIQGRVHSVWGAFALVHSERKVRLVESHETRVEMIPMDDELIQAYVRSGEPMDKAGAYAAQGAGMQYIAAIEGSFGNVIGLNIAAVMRRLREFNVLEAR